MSPRAESRGYMSSRLRSNRQIKLEYGKKL